MHDLALAAPVRQVEGDDVETGQLRERIGTSPVRPVAEADKQRLFVEPDQVASLGEGGLVEPSRDRETNARQIDSKRLRLGAAAVLPGPKQHGALVRDQHGVVDVDGVGVALDRRLAEHDFGAGAGQQLAERIVLARDPCRVGLGPPAVLAPEPQVVFPRRPQQDSPQRRSHRRTAVELRFSDTHQPKKAFATSYHSGGTVFSSAVASLRGTSTIRSPWSDAICPNFPSCARSAAFSPKRVASTRSRGVGEPPRWTCPSTVTRVSKPVRRSISRARASPTPRWDSRTWPNSSCSPASASPSSSYPSETTTIEKSLPRSCRRRMSSHASSIEIGCSGIRITSAPPAIPLTTAIQPVCRPITSTTMTRLCDSAVVCRRSIASVAMKTAVSNPKV